MQKIINRILLLIIVLLIGLLSYKTFTIPKAAEASAITTIEKQSPIEQQVSESDFQNKVELIVENYLKNNPDIIITSLEEFKKRKTQELEAKINNYIENNQSEIESTSNIPVIGNVDGDVIITAFYDYKCPHCKEGNDHMNQLIAADKKAKVIFRLFPILGETSNYATRIALAVNELFPEKFQVIHEGLMGTNPLTIEGINGLLSANDIDDTIVVAKANSDDIKDLINKNADLATKLRIHGVPTYIINGNLIRGAANLSQLQALITEIRAKANEQTSSQNPK